MSKEEEVKKLLKDRIPLHGERELDMYFLDLLVEDICKLFSPPPVVGDLKEKIARCLAFGGVTMTDESWKEIQADFPRITAYNFSKADSILALLEEVGWVKLADNQAILENVHLLKEIQSDS